MEFVHLHVNTEYTLLKSAAKVQSLVEKAKQLQYKALAITDVDVLYGVIPFYEACKKAGIKPIIGLELTISNDSNDVNRLILLAKTEKGYENLIKLSTISQMSSVNNHLVSKRHLFTYCNDLIAISSPYKGEVQQILEEGNIDLAKKTIKQYKTYFGDDFYIGIHDHFLSSQKQLNMRMHQLEKEGLVNLVVTNQVLYVNKEDALAHRCLLSINEGTTLKQLETDFITEEYYLKSKAEMVELFQHIPNALINTVSISEQCNVEIKFGEQKLPKYPLEKEETAKQMLRSLCNQGLRDRYEKIVPQIEERLEYELGIIDKMNFNDYFLIVSDFMKFAHDQNMVVGPGRGSAAGSLVAYVLNITDVDPIKYDLLFERFLNPERVTMPDIDIDFPDTRRDEVIEYVFNKYGKNHVAQIITFGTLAAKAALRDVGKVIGIPLKKIDSIAKLIPSRPNITIEEAVREIDLLKNEIKSNEDMKEWFKLARRVEGIPRHASTHAAGIVISEQPLTNHIPLQTGSDQVLLTQYSMNVLEQLGLLKMDFLGLRNLSFIEEIINHVEKITGDKINLSNIPFNDNKTFQLLSNGDTTGVFQLESPGMRRVLRMLKPTEFEDIVAVNALYRPGPMENIPLYIEGKHKKRKISYVHDDLKPILEKTYGVIIYQEQIMQIASKMAGFSLGEADILRRAVSKKNLTTLEAEREKFVNGCLNRGYDQKVAKNLYDLIVRFANYGFNRSHSVAYSIISFQLAYLKANYPTAFYAALLTSAIGGQQKLKQYIFDANQKGILVSAPSINKCMENFTISSKKEISFGLAAIKNVGMKMIEEIIVERNTNGHYHDIFDFCARINSKLMTRRTLEALVAAGCFDEFGHHRARLLATLDEAINYGEKIKSKSGSKQTALFDEEVIKPNYVEVPPFKEVEKLYFEKEVLGFYLSSHPIESYLEVLKTHDRIKITEGFLDEVKSSVRIAGLIESVRVIKTKKGEQMSFIKLSDESGEIDITVFPKTYREFSHILKEGVLIFLNGTLEKEKGEKQLIANKLIEVKSVKKRQDNKRTLYLKIAQCHDNQDQLLQLKDILKKYPGDTKVVLFYDEKNQYVQLSDDYKVTASNQCIVALCNILGKQNVVIKT